MVARGPPVPCDTTAAGAPLTALARGWPGLWCAWLAEFDPVLTVCVRCEVSISLPWAAEAEAVAAGGCGGSAGTADPSHSPACCCCCRCLAGGPHHAFTAYLLWLVALLSGQVYYQSPTLGVACLSHVFD